MVGDGIAVVIGGVGRSLGAQSNDVRRAGKPVGSADERVDVDGERTLTITVNQALPDGRHVMAQDDAGRVEIRIAPMLCQDSMSGADFPYTGRLTFDEAAPIPGCARPASDPPPGEPAAKRP